MANDKRFFDTTRRVRRMVACVPQKYLYYFSNWVDAQIRALNDVAVKIMADVASRSPTQDKK